MTSSDTLIKLESDTLRFTGVTVANPHHVALHRGVTVLFGPNGSGKSTLARIIEQGWNFMTNRITSPSGLKPTVKAVEFSDIHTLSGAKAEYYQQRHEATMNDEVPTVAEAFGDRIRSPRWQELCERLRLSGAMEKRLNFLSSGELRKLLLVNTLLDHPDLLVLDNPYIGLDAPSRRLLDSAIADIAAEGTAVMLLVGNPGEIPDCTGEIITMSALEITGQYTWDGNAAPLMALLDDATPPPSPELPRRKEARRRCHVALDMKNVDVTYGTVPVIRNLSWTVADGEQWALAGPNGSGKSVLLSLVYADNPQAYRNDITLFDRRRGTGESIWDIKDRIGYVSPEMHLYFRSAGSVEQVVAQGVRSATGSFGAIAPEILSEARGWLGALGIEHLAGRRYATLSAGEQRLVLLARTFIKHADLLILDEPLHGLDAARKERVRDIIGRITRDEGSTLIYVTHFIGELPASITHTKTLTPVKN